MKLGGRIRPFCGPLRFELFLSGVDQGQFLITFFNFVFGKSILAIFLPGVPHWYHRKQNFLFCELNPDVPVDLRLLIKNIIIRSLKTTLLPK